MILASDVRLEIFADAFSLWENRSRSIFEKTCRKLSRSANVGHVYAWFWWL